MSMDEFMKKLEYLLSDIPDEEKAEAIEYYRDYLEEAGPENEEKVIHDFGSPERIAAIIRTEISGNLEEGGEFTEKGYQDERFKDPNYQMAKRYDLPEVTEEYNKFNSETSEEPGKEKKTKSTNRTAKIILWIILIIAASPMLLGIGGGLMGILGGIFGILVAAVVVVAVLTFALLVAGVAMLLAGFVSMAVHPLSGILLIGIGVVIFGFGLLGLAFSGVFYGKFLPFLFQSCVNFIQRLLYGRRSRI